MTTTNNPTLDGLADLGMGTTPSSKDATLSRWLDHAVETGEPLSVVGDAGYAKTASTKAHFAKRGITALVISLAQVDWDSFFAPYPEGEGAELRVTTLLHADLLTADDKVLVFDESRRADKRSRQVLLEVMSEGSIGGIPIPGLRTVITLDNPGGSAEYLGVSALDPAQGDRSYHITLGIYDTPWKQWFEESFPTVDWAPVWRWHVGLDREERKVMNARNLEHMAKLGLAGFPVGLGLGVLPSGRIAVTNARGEDTSEATLAGFCQALGVPYTPVESVDVVALIDWCLLSGENLRVIGPHGRAKTAYVKARVTELSEDFASDHGVPLEVEAFSAPLLSPADLAILAPGGPGELRHIIADRFTRPGRKIVVLEDERSRADRRISASLMSLEQEHALAGQHLDTIQCVVALDNPSTYKGLRYETGRLDTAQVSRFTATVEISDHDLPWKEHLLDTFGEAARPFVDWWFEDLDAYGQATVTARTLQRLIRAHARGLPLRPALGVIGHDQVEVPLVDLERRLADAEVIGFGRLVEEVDELTGRIAAGDEILALEAKNALATADPDRLAAHREVCERYALVLPKDLCSALVRTNESDRQAFWAQVIQVRLKATS